MRAHDCGADGTSTHLPASPVIAPPPVAGEVVRPEDPVPRDSRQDDRYVKPVPGSSGTNGDDQERTTFS